MMAMPKLPVDVLTPSHYKFNHMSQARFLVVPLRHAIVRMKTSTMVKTKYACRQASISDQAL
jgi:hypothetical protein